MRHPTTPGLSIACPGRDPSSEGACALDISRGCASGSCRRQRLPDCEPRLPPSEQNGIASSRRIATMAAMEGRTWVQMHPSAES